MVRTFLYLEVHIASPLAFPLELKRKCCILNYLFMKKENMNTLRALKWWKVCSATNEHYSNTRCLCGLHSMQCHNFMGLMQYLPNNYHWSAIS